MEKYWNHCDTTKFVTEFYKASHTKDGLQGWCKKCQHASVAKKKYSRSRKHLDAKIRNRYKLTIEEHEQLIKNAQGKCAICGRVSDKLVIDHCHKTDKIRGLLCFACNTGLGLFQDNTKTLLIAIEYLEKE